MTNDLTAFEAANVALKQAYLGTSALAFNDIPQSFLGSLPRAVAHWKREDGILFRPLGQGGKQRMLHLLDGHAQDGSLSGWNIFRDSNKR